MCTDLTTGETVDTGGSFPSWTINIPVHDRFTCNVTNTAKTASLALVKSVSPISSDSFVVGALLTYSFVVTNTGGLPLTDISVAETAFSGSGSLSAVSCPAGAASLLPGASVTCTATYTVTQADVDAGSVTNTAVASGTDPDGGGVESSPSSAQFAADVPSTPPGLAITGADLVPALVLAVVAFVSGLLMLVIVYVLRRNHA